MGLADTVDSNEFETKEKWVGPFRTDRCISSTLQRADTATDETSCET